MKTSAYLAVSALLALLVAVAYGNSLWTRYTMDDDFIIVDNPMIRNLERIPRLFATDYWAREGATDHLVPRTTGLYRPLVLTSYALNYRLTGLVPWSYHLVNLLLHGLCTWLTFLIALRIGLSVQGSAIAAAIFALHPLHTEAVTGIVGRAELLMAVGVLGGLWLAAEGRLWLSLGAFLGGLLAKEQAVMLPAVIVLYDLCARKRVVPKRIRGITGRKAEPLFSKTDLYRYGSYVVVLAGYLVARGLVLGGVTLPSPPFLDNPLAEAGTAERILTAVKVAGRYLWLSVWPASLSADYSYNAIPLASSLLEPGVMLGVLTWGGLTGWMVHSYRNGDRRIAFSIGFTILLFLPVSNLIVPIGTIMGERLFYLPSAGLCLLAGLAYERALSRNDVRRSMFDVSGADRDRILNVERRTSNVQPRTSNLEPRTVLRLLVVVICLALMVRTIVRNSDWVDNGTLFRSAGKTVPSSAKMRSYLGRVFQSERDWEQARSQYEAAVRIYPAYARTDASLNVNVGDVYFKLGQLEQAAEALERAIRLAPVSPEAHYNLGLVYARLKRYEEAEPMVRRALALKPGFPEAKNTLSRLLVERGRYEDAVTAADEALAKRPGFSEALYNRGLALRALGRTREAEAAFRQAMERETVSRPIPGIVGQ